jgi:LysM repeat protein
VRRIIGVLVLLVALVAAGHAAFPTRATRVTAAPRSYVLQRGDSLERVARRFGTSVAALARLNKLPNVHVVQTGARLTVPPAEAKTGGGDPALPDSGRGLPPRLLSDPVRLRLVPRFDHWAKTYRVPPDLLKAMTWMESGWQNHKKSPVGAHGIGQLMPDTVDFVSGNLLREGLDPRRPDDNIKMSARFLRYLLDQNGGNASRALAAYYQGLRSVRERGTYPETKSYVEAITSLRRRFR